MGLARHVSGFYGGGLARSWRVRPTWMDRRWSRRRQDDRCGSTAKRYGFHLYVADDALQGRSERPNRPEYPLTQAFMAMDMDQLWVRRSPEEMFRTFHRFQGEGFDVIVDDLRVLVGGGTGVIAEGMSLIPRLVPRCPQKEPGCLTDSHVGVLAGGYRGARRQVEHRWPDERPRTSIGEPPRARRALWPRPEATDRRGASSCASH